MKKPQITVAVGAGSGVLAMIGALLLLPHWLSSLPSTATVGDRLGYAAKWNALAAAPLFLAIIAVGNARFRSDAIDPTAGRETAAMLINSNMVDNTLQQYALFVVAEMAVAASSRGTELGVISAAAMIFVVARVAFWIGYRINPLYRAFGFASTAYLNLVLFAIAAWRAWD